MTLDDLKFVENVEVVRLAPNDVIVVTAQTVLSALEVERIGEALKRVWPNHQVVVLENGMSMKVAKAGHAPPTEEP